MAPADPAGPAQPGPPPGPRSGPVPLFPLDTVLFPGTVLPLHIFEPRYRALVRDLLAGPQPGEFGVVCVLDDVTMGDVVCVARLLEVIPLPDGRYDIVTVGGRRLWIEEIHHDRPYLTVTGVPLPEDLGDLDDIGVLSASAPRPAGLDLGDSVRRLFARYAADLAGLPGVRWDPPTLPDDPAALSYTVADALVLDLPAKQQLLEAPDAATRLRALRQLLLAERRHLRVIPSLPADRRTFPGVHGTRN